MALEELRAAVRSGIFDAKPEPSENQSGPLTFSQLAEIYKQRHVFAKRLAMGATIDYRLRPLIDRFGTRPIREIRTTDIEDFITDLRGTRSRRNLPLAPASINRTIELLRHMLNWAVGREYLDKSPFRRGTENLIRPELEDNVRRRRISEHEETRLLAAAPPFLRTMVITALDTGMRRGEMLALRWADIDLDRGLIVLHGATTKSGRTRRVPIGTTRLQAVLKWLRLDAGGGQKPDQVAVFSNEAGEPIRNFKKTWVATVLRANDIRSHWRKPAYKDLTADCQVRFREINLHWHDLRHEYASRLVERGVPLAQVRDLLGHASILTTERYDNQTLEKLQAAARRLDTGQGFDSAANPKCQEFIKIGLERTSPKPTRMRATSPTN